MWMITLTSATRVDIDFMICWKKMSLKRMKENVLKINERKCLKNEWKKQNILFLKNCILICVIWVIKSSKIYDFPLSFLTKESQQKESWCIWGWLDC